MGAERNLTSQELLCSLAVSSSRGFLPKKNKEESHFSRDSVHCLPRPTSLLKKSFAEQFSVSHVQGTTVPSLPWGHPTACPHSRHRQILTPLPFIFLSHRCRVLQNGHLTPSMSPVLSGVPKDTALCSLEHTLGTQWLQGG